MCEFPAVARPSDKQTDHLEERASRGTQSLWDVSTVAQRPVATGLNEMDALLTWQTCRVDEDKRVWPDTSLSQEEGEMLR